jgi:hypothetical protein
MDMKQEMWKTETALFWFLPEGTELDLSAPSTRDRVLQHVLTRGADSDVIKLLRMLPPDQFIDSFNRMKRFVPLDVRKFWERYIADHYPIAASSVDSP